MAADTRPSPQDLCRLIDSLITASEVARGGNAEAVETCLQCFNSLKQLQVRHVPSFNRPLNVQLSMYHDIFKISTDLVDPQVNTQLLVETQAGKKLRKLTKHQDLNIKGSSAELLNVWKGIVSSEAAAVEKGKEEVGESPFSRQDSLRQAASNAGRPACPSFQRDYHCSKTF